MEKLDGLKLLRAPFPLNQISKLPKGSKAQNACPPEQKINCKICGGWHHPKIIHLDYVGHAALTDRLLDVDPEWSWEPVAYDSHGLPQLDNCYGLWIKLTVLGVTRLGYGHPDGKTGGDAIKESIGDALRNAAMRFGAALDLWHKGDLHLDDEQQDPTPIALPVITPEQVAIVREYLVKTGLNEAEFVAQGGYQSAEQIYAKDYPKVMKILKNLAGEK